MNGFVAFDGLRPNEINCEFSPDQAIRPTHASDHQCFATGLLHATWNNLRSSSLIALIGPPHKQPVSSAMTLGSTFSPSADQWPKMTVASRLLRLGTSYHGR